MRPSGRARIDPSHPEALGLCDRCGFQYNLVDLHYQHEWAGSRLTNLRLRVCDTCMDKPQPQLRDRAIPPDPEPVRDPRPAALPIDI